MTGRGWGQRCIGGGGRARFRVVSCLAFRVSCLGLRVSGSGLRFSVLGFGGGTGDHVTEGDLGGPEAV